MAKSYTVELTREQIAIIKAGLQYYSLADEYGYATWNTIPGATIGSNDWYYKVKVGELYHLLNERNRVRPDYGWWGNIKYLAKLCKIDYKRAKREGREAERRMFEGELKGVR